MDMKLKVAYKICQFRDRVFESELIVFFFLHAVIPGISSAIAAPCSIGIPPTMRDIADQILVCTGHGKQDSFPQLPEFCSHRTTVFLMAMSRLSALVAELLKIGYDCSIFSTYSSW